MIVSAAMTLARGNGDAGAGGAPRRLRRAAIAGWRAYQTLTLLSMRIARNAAAENQATLPWPRGTTMKAASSGPIAEPALPPTWNSDWARPCRPPDAIRATRDASGWNTDEPRPTSAAASRIIG